MTKNELIKLVNETTKEVFAKNPDLLKEEFLPSTIEIAVKLSSLTNIRLLQKLGVLEETKD